MVVKGLARLSIFSWLSWTSSFRLGCPLSRGVYTTTSSCSGRFDEHASLEAAIYRDINVIAGPSVREGRNGRRHGDWERGPLTAFVLPGVWNRVFLLYTLLSRTICWLLFDFHKLNKLWAMLELRLLFQLFTSVYFDDPCERQCKITWKPQKKGESRM